MPVREAERRAEDDVEPAVTPEDAEAQATKFSAEGELPAVSAGGTDSAATASELAFDNQQVQGGDTSFLDSGMHDPVEYAAACQQAGKPEKWDDRYSFGHTEAKQFNQPYDLNETMCWTLQAGQSASQAVKDFIAGPTIADYRAMGVALELDELRDDLGDIKFDQLFGSLNDEEDAGVAPEHRLQITAAMYTTPFVDQMKAYAKEHDAGPAEVAPLPPPVVEQREDKPKQPVLAEEPIIVAEDLGKQPEREVL